MDQKIGDRIKEKRERAGFSLQDVAEKLDVNRSSVLRWENGDTGKIKLPVIEKLAQILHTTPAYLMGWEDSEETAAPKKESILDQIKNLKGTNVVLMGRGGDGETEVIPVSDEDYDEFRTYLKMREKMRKEKDDK